MKAIGVVVEIALSLVYQFVRWPIQIRNSDLRPRAERIPSDSAKARGIYIQNGWVGWDDGNQG